MKAIELTKSNPGSLIGKIAPLSPRWALVHFLLAGLGVRLAIYNIRPFLLEIGLSGYEAFIMSITIPCAILFALAFRAIQAEGRPENIRAFATRLRLFRPTKRHWLWLLMITTAVMISSAVLSSTQMWLIERLPFLHPAASFPVLINPTLQNQDFLAAIAQWLGPQAAGNWGSIILIIIMFIFNILGEELYFRGTLLPRQEMVHGRRAWLVHGMLWHLYHVMIFPWYLISGLPLALGISYIAQKTGNTWMPIIFHGLANLSMIVLVTLVVTGGA